MDILYRISVILSYILMVCYSYLDIKYREIKRRYILLSYPVIFFIGYTTYNFSLDLLIGFVWMFLFFTVLDLYNRYTKEEDTTYIGTCDIIVAPLFTIWYGYRFIPYLFIFGLVLLVAERVKVKAFVNNICVYKNCTGIPLIPYMTLSYLLTEYVLLAIKFL